ncbi:hypothetical protein SteCoe_27300 [Stentor coeruleus]|uniref:B box-type domain-containing protein n=1 Tax=Stentor coeruleus TaxID=5963 RepID=A0A1R2BAW2_9CILI|nr:hypothetical protein SteCoe_27300 [Stentor coeruleus]
MSNENFALDPRECYFTGSIPSNLAIESGSCLKHNKSFKLYCEKCSALLCSACVLQHNYHRISIISEKISQISKHFEDFEQCILISLRIKLKNYLENFYADFLNEFKRLQALNVKEFITQSQSSLEFYYTKFKEVDTDYQWIPLDCCRDVYKLGRSQVNESAYSQFLHYIEWKENILHVIDLNNIKSSTYTLPNNFLAPLYYRSILLPFKRIFICGGRMISAEPGLKKSYILQIANELKIQNLPDMKTGRSNHLVLYCNDTVYVIGGLDSSNTYTNSCEKYSLQTNTWTSICDLLKKKDALSGCSNPKENCLYTFGGRNIDLFIDIEKYIISDDCWERLPVTLPFETCLNGACFMQNEKKVLIFAGQNMAADPLAVSCIVDLNNNTTEKMPEIPDKGGCIVDHPALFNEKIYCLVFKGFPSRKLFAWDIRANRWQVIMDF